MKPSLRPLAGASIETRTRCACAARLSSHPFGTIKSWMGATHFQMKTLKNVDRNGAARPGLQHETGNEHSGRCGLVEAIRA